MPKQTPKIYNIPSVDLIITPNKNIQSYYMKSDTTRQPPKKRQIENTKIVCIIDNDIIIDNETYKINIFKNLNFDTSISLLKSVSKLAILRNLVKNQFLCIIFNDFLTRSEIIGIIDYFINSCNCKGVMVIPYSLSVCFALNVNNGIVVKVDEYFSYIEDNVLVERVRKCNKLSYNNKLGDDNKLDDNNKLNYSNKSDNDNKLDDDKLSNDNSKLDNNSESKEINNLQQSLDLKDGINLECDYDILDEIREQEYKKLSSLDDYFKSETKITESKKYNENIQYFENFKDELKNFIKIKNIKKSFENLIINENDDKEYFMRIIDDLKLKLKILFCDKKTAIEGANVFLNLDISYDLWVFDDEWRDFRLKVLRERILFYI